MRPWQTFEQKEIKTENKQKLIDEIEAFRRKRLKDESKSD